MPKNREALIRYRIINRLLINRKYVSLQEMIAACEDALDKAPISVRTLRQDIFDMKNNRQLGYFAPIKYDYTGRAYHYTDQNYSIDRLPLTDEEIDALAFAGRMLEQFKGTEPFDQIEGAVDKILQHLKIRKEITAEEYRNFIDFEKSTITRSSEYIEILIKVIKKRQVILITHKPFYEEKAFTTRFHPYLLKEYRNWWYVFGYSEHHKESRTFALDRIKKIEPEPLKIFIEPKFPPRDYFSKIIGISRMKGSREGRILLKFSRLQANYVLTQPLHESQKIVEESDNHVIISLDIYDSPDLIMILLSLGKEVEVLEPSSLRNDIKRIHVQSAELYRINTSLPVVHVLPAESR
jgi:predicted DNA-binding transcriptional regulator YafY